jgi:Family of unknown function (DUF5675)
MKIYVKRGKSTLNSTPGKILVDMDWQKSGDADLSKFECFCLEPPEGGFDETRTVHHVANTIHYSRIPAGKYWCEHHFSQLLQDTTGVGDVLWIRNGDPNFDNRMYYFHIGNACQNGPYSKIIVVDETGKKEKQCDTHGCNLPGLTQETDWVGNSKTAFLGLLSKAIRVINGGGKVWVDILD